MQAPPARPALAALALLGALVTVVLIAGASGYGYHGDELYFLVCGKHLAWGYADQGPLTPFIAYLMQAIAPGSLIVLRIPSALMTGAYVVTTGAIAFELGATRRAQLIAAACAAVGVFALFVGHLLSTTTFDLLAWTVVSWLIVRAVRTGDVWLWTVAGAVAGLALLDKPLIAFLLVALAVSLCVCGPRDVLRDRRLWIGVALALVLWSPWLVWQAIHGWPQIDVGRSISDGNSGSSQPRWQLLPFQLLLVSPLLSPVWIAGLVALARRAALRPFRFLALTWLVLVLLFLAAGGKAYYLGGWLPVLLAAGAIEVDGWLGRGAGRARGGLLAAAIGLSAIVSLLVALPILPAGDAGPVIALNGDVGETIGWPQFARTVAGVYRQAPGAVIFTANYSEAGAIDRYGPALGLPGAYSGHNAFGQWGPPPDRAGPVVVVGFDVMSLMSDFTGCRQRAQIGNSAGVHNDERGSPVALCTGTRQPWSRLWPGLRHLD